MTTNAQTTYTPGPWGYYAKLSASENHKGFNIHAEANRLGVFIAQVSPRDVDGDEGEANARLIAAAPELLAELREIVEGWEQIEQGKVKMRRLTSWEEERLDFARQIIAKATGGAL